MAMYSTWRKITMATRNALAEFRRTYADPASISEKADDERRAAYALLWAYYTNSAFEDLAQWQAYRGRHSLYRGTRPIFNPVRRLVDFYAGTIYQGAWAQKPEHMTEPGTAIPFADGTPPALLGAIAQLWQWSNWQSQKAIPIRYAAAVGDALAVVVDEPARGRIYIDTIWPGHVAEIDADPRGNVEAYTLEYGAIDAAGKPYTYRREVNKRTITEKADGSIISQIANPYGFTAAAWIQHTPTTAEHGEPALRRIGPIDEINSFASHALDHAGRVLSAPILIAGENIDLDPGRPAGARVPTTTNNGRTDAAQKVNVITGASGADIKALQMDTGDAIAHIDHLLAEIERDHPEITMYTQLRGMSQVTGPAAARLFGDVAAYVDAARAQYDQATIKLCQMAVAIGGWRISTGAWGSAPSRQQSAFTGFNLDSYAAGNLDLEIQSRPLIPLTEEEKISLERQQIGLDADRAYTQAGAQQPGNGTPAAIAARIQAAGQRPQEEADR